MASIVDRHATETGSNFARLRVVRNDNWHELRVELTPIWRKATGEVNVEAVIKAYEAPFEALFSIPTALPEPDPSIPSHDAEPSAIDLSRSHKLAYRQYAVMQIPETGYRLRRTRAAASSRLVPSA